MYGQYPTNPCWSKCDREPSFGFRFWSTVRSGYLARKRPHESRKEKHVQPALRRLDFGLLRDLQRVIYFNPEVSHSAFELAMAKQELNGP